MPSNPIIKTLRSFTELMAHWQCSENDLRDAIITGQLVPSVYVRGVVWEIVVDSLGKGKTQTQGVYVNELMYLVEVERLGVSDCAFKYFSRKTHLRGAGSLFKPDASAYVDVRKRLSDVERDGRFTVDSISEAEASNSNQTHAQFPAASTSKTQWWNTEYDVSKLANEIKQEWIKQGRPVIQSGSRHGKYGRLPIGEAVSKQIADYEKLAKNRFIGGKTIADFLNKIDWD